MNETRKSAIRRAHDPAFVRYFRGAGLDIGVENDPLSAYARLFPFIERVTTWNHAQGDALHLQDVGDCSYDFVHSNHGLAMIDEPVQALSRWLDVVKPGGHVIFTVPDEDLHGKNTWPNRFAPDQKNSFTIAKPKDSTRLPRSINVLDLVNAMLPIAACERMVRIRDGYDDKQDANVDQAEGLAECAIEVVLRKREVPSLWDLLDAAVQADNADDSFAASRRAMTLYPYRFDAYHRTMLQMLRWGVPEQEGPIWEAALAWLPNSHGVHLYRWLHAVLAGRLHDGFRLRETRFVGAPWQRRTQAPPPVFVPAWNGESLEGKSIVIWSEFGLGDEIFFFRFARILRERCGAARVSVVCQPSLLELFQTSGIADVVADINHLADLPPIDYWVYPHAIPAHLPLDLEALPPTVPYLRVPDGQTLPAALQHATPGVLRVGVVFKGAPTHENDIARSLSSLSRLERLFELEGVEFFSLQKGAGADEAARYAQALPNFHDLGAELHTMAKTAAAINALDLVLTVDTSVAHLAAAMGKPVWLMLPLLCDWRWHYKREDSPWYPTVRIFRNGWNDGNSLEWDKVVERIRTALEELKCKTQ
ncbi:MAG: methyltransferase domain-containing protein [Gallionellaceae bacterium]|jgi:SAM-dependent methyltransferase|nr:methyltransferase domain-containing protein [Gallionellaceae bacterium]